MATKSAWTKVGVIGVDAGLCWIGDPCYVLPDDAKGNPGADWSEFCNRLGDGPAKQWAYPLGHPGLGVSVSTGYGDGEYPVYVRLNPEGRVAEVKVVFI